ncbi:MAG TPA: hypothetical protein PLU11_03150 [Chitinophagaceae bacterium]|nr:hypothetical protein [Chitinophagaceae bacterium]HPH33446.1 hypothetical protein [Chitinophagaceae bacterium]HPN58137.1 hypothetical protein [Chitinophagaceae bacterium]
MKIALSLCLLLTSLSLSAQFVAKMEIKEPIKGLCNEKDVYAILPIGDQKEAICPVSEEEIARRLDSTVVFLKEHQDFKGKGMVSVIINCKGEVVKCEMDNKTKYPELDKQIVAVFAVLGQWKAGKIGKKEVDSVKLFSFEIKNGKISLN